jgi:hypothetical protein
MTHTDNVVEDYVMGDRRVVVVDVNITSLDEEGFENWDPSQYEGGTAQEVWPVGRESGVRQIIRWDELDGERLHVTKANGTSEPAGNDVGRVRIRVVMDR